MEYITGIHALNIDCSQETPGDWHTSALKWEKLTVSQVETSYFGDYGLEYDVTIPEHNGVFTVANHIRAVLDLMVSDSLYLVKGMRENFISNEMYIEEIFEKVYELRFLNHWNKIYEFMRREYFRKWSLFVSEKWREKEKWVGAQCKVCSDIIFYDGIKTMYHCTCRSLRFGWSGCQRVIGEPERYRILLNADFVETAFNYDDKCYVNFEVKRFIDHNEDLEHEASFVPASCNI